MKKENIILYLAVKPGEKIKKNTLVGIDNTGYLVNITKLNFKNITSVFKVIGKKEYIKNTMVRLVREV